eukprot:1066449-Rhodomonas_salina.1
MLLIVEVSACTFSEPFDTANVLAHQGHIPPRVEYHLARRVDYLWPDCPTELQDFVQDGGG